MSKTSTLLVRPTRVWTDWRSQPEAGQHHEGM